MQSRDTEKPLLDHLEDLRWVIIKTLSALFIGAVLCFIFTQPLMNLLKHPLSIVLKKLNNPSNIYLLKTLSPTSAFTLTIKMAFGAGFILSLPFILYFIIDFITPALTSREKKAVLPIGMLICILFIVGISFAFYVALPLTLLFLWKYNLSLGIEPAWTIENFLSFEMTFLGGFGIMFEIPLAILALVYLGIISRDQLIAKRRHAILASFIIGAVLTPPDPISQICMSIPLVLLYELCIWLALLVENKKTIT